MLCPHCGQTHAEDIRFCPNTGKEIIRRAVCPHCGAHVEPQWQHCSVCGESLLPPIAPADAQKQPPSAAQRTPAIQRPQKEKRQPPLRLTLVAVFLGLVILVAVAVAVFIRPGWAKLGQAAPSATALTAVLTQPPQGTAQSAALTNQPQATTLAVVSPVKPGKIVFVSNRDKNLEIYAMNPDGSQQTRLTHVLSEFDNDFPRWSPDGQKIAFVSNREGNPEIYTMDPNGSHLVNLTQNKAGDYCPAWSPDGKTIAFISDRDGSPQIYLMNADGSKPTLIPNTQLGTTPSLMSFGGGFRIIDVSEANNIGLSWSPDGQRIVYNSTRSGDSKIYIVNRDGSQQSTLSGDAQIGQDYAPAWSVDGQKIAFSSSRNGNLLIYVMNADGSHAQPLFGDESHQVSGPVWSADGSQLAFLSNGNGHQDVYSIHADGSGLAQLTSNQGDNMNLDWARVAAPTTVAATMPTSDTTSGTIGEMVEVPGGTFKMGCDPQNNGGQSCPSGTTLRQVNLDTFWIDKYEVTNASYARCVDAGVCTTPLKSSSATRPSYFGNPAYASYPVIYVNWSQAATYCGWAGKRLPTEAEWEKAARGPANQNRYPWGSSAPDCTVANYGGSAGCAGDTNAVGSYPFGASPYGAMDMVGNVWEWVADWWQNGYGGFTSLNNPLGPADGNYHVFRGGDWQTTAAVRPNYDPLFGGIPTYLSLSYRISSEYTLSLYTDPNAHIPDYYNMDNYNVGFRCAASSANGNAQGNTQGEAPTETPSPVKTAAAPKPGSANLAGRVIWNNQPVPDAKVRLCTEENCYQPQKTTSTDAHGWFAFTEVPPAKYSVQVKALDPKSDLWFSFYPLTKENVSTTYPYNNQPNPVVFDLKAGQTLGLGNLYIYKTDLSQKSPKDGEKVSQQNPTLTWDAYPGAAYYGLYLGSPYPPTYAEKVVGTSYTISEPLTNCDYRWQVEAYDQDGIKISEAPGATSFTVVNQASACNLTLKTPADKAVLKVGEKIEFTWEGQAPVFVFWLQDRRFKPVMDPVHVTTTSFTLPQGLPIGEYRWGVDAYDGDRKVAGAILGFDFTVVDPTAPTSMPIGSPAQTIKGNFSSSWGMVFSPDGKTLAVGSDKGRVTLWDVSSGAQLRTLEGPGDTIYSLAFSYDGKFLAAGAFQVTIWNLQDGTLVKSLPEQAAAVTHLSFSPNGQFLAASADQDYKVSLWRLSDFSESATFELPKAASQVTSIGFSPDGKTLGVAAADRTIDLFQVSDGSLLHTFGKADTAYYSENIRNLVFSPNGQILASSLEDNVVLWRISDGSLVHTLAGHGDTILNIAFSPGGDTLSSISSDGTVYLWQVSDGALLRRLAINDGDKNAVFSMDGQTFARIRADWSIAIHMLR